MNTIRCVPGTYFWTKQNLVGCHNMDGFPFHTPRHVWIPHPIPHVIISFPMDEAKKHVPVGFFLDPQTRAKKGTRAAVLADRRGGGRQRMNYSQSHRAQKWNTIGYETLMERPGSHQATLWNINKITIRKVTTYLPVMTALMSLLSMLQMKQIASLNRNVAFKFWSCNICSIVLVLWCLRYVVLKWTEG